MRVFAGAMGLRSATSSTAASPVLSAFSARRPPLTHTLGIDAGCARAADRARGPNRAGSGRRRAACERHRVTVLAHGQRAALGSLPV